MMRLSRRFVSEIRAIIEACYHSLNGHWHDISVKSLKFKWQHTSNYLSLSRFRYFDHDETLAIEDPKKMIGSEADGSNGKLIKNFTTILTTSETPRCQSVGDD